MNTAKFKISTGDRIFSFFNYLIFTLFTIICAYPFYYLIINSISANDLSANGMINWLPRNIQFHNYIDVFQIQGLFTAAFISVAVFSLSLRF